jgi:hypothetical protein
VIRWSPEVRVLRAPARAFRELAAEPSPHAWSFTRPLILLLLLGSTVSLQASGRVSARLLLDGMIAFAFVPVFMIAAIAVVYRRRPRTVTFSRALDVFFAANAPWLVLLIAFDTWRTFLTPAQAGAMLEKPLYLVLFSFAAVVIWSTYIDLRFFREFLPRVDGRAGRDLLLARTISWIGIVAYFAGHEFWEYFALWINV